MSTITTRSGKGSPLTNNEIDDNFTNLNTDKYQSGDTPTFAGLTTTADVSFGDNDKAIFGAGSDLQIYHDGTASYIDDAGTGALVIRSNEIQLQKYTGETLASFLADGVVQLRYDNVVKLATTTTGIDVTGTAEMDTLSIGGTAVTSTAAELNYNDITTLGTVEASKTVTADANGDVTFPDNKVAYFGDSNDLEIYHSGLHSWIKDAGTGILFLVGDSQIALQNASSENYINCASNGAVTLYYDNAAKLATATGGVTVTGDVSATTHSIPSYGTLQAPTGDLCSIEVDGGGKGGWEGYSIGGRANFMHDNSSSYGLYDDVNSQWALNATMAGKTELYHAGSSKLETLSTGVHVTGELRATGDVIAYYSDDRLKTNLGKIENALEKVESLEGFYYEANEKAQELGYEVKREVGISAQSVEKVMPEVVAPAPIDEQYLTVKYERLVPLLIESIKELSAEVKELRAEVKELKG